MGEQWLKACPVSALCFLEQRAGGCATEHGGSLHQSLPATFCSKELQDLRRRRLKDHGMLGGRAAIALFKIFWSADRILTHYTAHPLCDLCWSYTICTSGMMWVWGMCTVLAWKDAVGNGVPSHPVESGIFKACMLVNVIHKK